ncbi:MAG TPA: type 1 glutamine amidotransferase [Solirubrobacteraceae bacterium]|nr:type 1 glutamine amidotransferase [Solirubrobacteraceae bacterium]
MGADAPILILQHIDCEPPAAYEDELLARGVELHRVRLDEGDGLPDRRSFAGIVAMGGPMGTYDESAHPWLHAEKRFIADAVRADMPYWGVCLGAQLLAASLGGPVTPGPAPEVGIAPVRLTDGAAHDPVFAAAPPVFDALHWHGDTYELPPGAVRLASSAQYEQQAFVFRRAYGLQFHLEVTPALARQWIGVPVYADSLEQVMGAGASSVLLGQLDRASSGAIALARRLFGRWLGDVVGAGPPR